MKKAKLILAAIAVFAVVGGVYASKAKRGSDVIFVRGADSYCTVPLVGFTLTRPANAPIASTTFATTQGTICTTTVPYYTGL